MTLEVKLVVVSKFFPTMTSKVIMMPPPPMAGGIRSQGGPVVDSPFQGRCTGRPVVGPPPQQAPLAAPEPPLHEGGPLVEQPLQERSTG